ncbi:MAG: Sialic acid TRAP transporter permease protein SiaT [Planctomycetes bacterium ADurb.Bin401]|nr:MAG: Sialic acid TRAP transporter permease protein SiaT [Planctomycetes bacterium ADurb.Bin401]
MSLTMIGLLGIAVLMVVLFLTATPVAFAMAVVGFLGFCCVVSFDAAVNMVGSVLWATFSKYDLTVIPLFILMGQIVFYSGINEKLYHAAYNWVGHIRGGIAMATVIACSAFAAICGSNTATAATMSTVALPQMKKYGYNPKLSTGSVAAGSTLGVVIPPSVVLILIGLSTEQSIVKLFYGGFGAGIVLTLMLVATVYIICSIKPQWGPVGEKVDFKTKVKSLSGAGEMVLLFLLVIIGLYAGFFTPAEAAAAGAFIALIIALVRKQMPIKQFIKALKDTLRASCMVMMIVAGAMIFGKFLAVTRLPYNIADWVATLAVSKTVVLLIIFAIYIIGGMIMDALALLIITIPIFFPIATGLGYDPLWFGVTITVITTLGAISPPVGAVTFVVASVAKDVKMKDVFKGVSIFIPAYILCVLLLMAFPKIATLLPSLLK